MVCLTPEWVQAILMDFTVSFGGEDGEGELLRVRSWDLGPASRLTWKKSDPELHFPAQARGANRYRMIVAYEEPFVFVVQSCVDLTQGARKVKPCWYLDAKEVLARGEVLPPSVQVALEEQSSRFLARIGDEAGFKEDWMPAAARQYCSQFLSPAGAGVWLSLGGSRVSPP